MPVNVEQSFRVALLGNVGPGSPDFSTENEWVRAYGNNGITVDTYCEEDVEQWWDLIDILRTADKPDLIHWTSTPHWRQKIDREVQEALLRAANRNGIPVIGVHLDRFWDIRDRERWIKSGDPYFKVDKLFTADGGNDDKWEQQGVNHRWLLPGVGEQWCHRGEVRDEYRAEIAFVGSWYRYHSESKHRAELIRWLQGNFGDVKLWPERKKHAIRGDDLTDLYWSTDVVVGDSFFPSRGQHLPPPNYASDRISESLGRGAMLLFTEIDGITDGPFAAPNLETWRPWRWKELKRKIEESLDMAPSVRTRKRNAGIKYIREHHTYECRVREVMDVLVEEKFL